MISDPAGSSLKVMGRRSATVSAGPMPGNTPTAVPSVTPIRAKSRFPGSMATSRPLPSAAKLSIPPSKQVADELQKPCACRCQEPDQPRRLGGRRLLERPGWKHELQGEREYQPDGEGQNNAERIGEPKPFPAEGARGTGKH